MSPDADDFWARARTALQSAEKLVSSDPDAAASRAYYAAFYATSALFASEGRFFTKHSAVKQAVHRDLVQSGRWERDHGESYSVLLDLRATGDYGGEQHVSQKEAEMAVQLASRIVETVRIALGTSESERLGTPDSGGDLG